MRYQPDLHQAVDMDALRRRVARWQAGRVGRSRMPKALRRDVLALVAHVGVYRAAADLGLSYSTLKRWCDAELPLAETPGTDVPAFVEWLAPTVPGVRQQGLECTLEVETVRGLRLKLSVTGVDSKALSTLLRDLVA